MASSSRTSLRFPVVGFVVLVVVQSAAASLVATTVAWCRRRPRMLTVVVYSGRKQPHCSKGQWEARR